jgi:ribonuclease Z
MFSSDASERAREYGHSTVAQAATIARKSHSRNLALTHFSAIYEDTKQLLAEAKAIFPRTMAAEDLGSLELP